MGGVSLLGLGAKGRRLYRGSKGRSRGGVLVEEQPVPSPPARGSGERCKLPAGSGAVPQPKLNLVHFNRKNLASGKQVSK